MIERIAVGFFVAAGSIFVGIMLAVALICIAEKIKDFKDSLSWDAHKRGILQELNSIDRWCAEYPQVVATCERIEKVVESETVCHASTFRDSICSLSKIKADSHQPSTDCR